MSRVDAGEKIRWNTFVARALSRVTKKALYENIKAASDVRAHVAAAAKSQNYTLSAAKSDELLRAVNVAGETSERVRTFFYAAYPHAIGVPPPEEPKSRPRVRRSPERRAEGATESTESEDEKERVGGNNEGGAGRSGGATPTLQTDEERSREKQQEMDAVRGAGELAIWERWLVPGAQVQARFSFFLQFPTASQAWTHVRSLPSYTEDQFRNADIRLSATVMSCRDGTCVVRLAPNDFTTLSDEQRTVVFLWRTFDRIHQWSPTEMSTHNVEIFGRTLATHRSHLYAPPDMIVGLTRRFLAPSARGMKVPLYRPWKYGVFYENEYLSGTWTEGEIRRQVPAPTGARLIIHVDNQNVTFALPGSDTLYTYIPLVEGKTTVTETLPTKGRRRLRTLPASYELSLVPHLSEQLATISASITLELPLVLIRLIGQMLA